MNTGSMSIQRRITGSAGAVVSRASGRLPHIPHPLPVTGDEQERRVASMLDRLADELRALGIVF